jgi:hypothetical protein
MKTDFGRLTGNPEYYKYKPVGDQFYCVWNDENGIDKDWGQIFEFVDPIQFRSPEEPTGKKIKRDLSNIWPEKGIVEVPELKKSGYLKSYFRFLEKRIIPFYEAKEDFLRLEGQMNFDVPNIELLGKVGTAKDLLFSQIQRQANKVQSINQEIVDILKVVFYESELTIRSNSATDKINELNLLPDIRHLFRNAVVGGDYSDNFKAYWIPAHIESNDYITDALKGATSLGLLKLVNEREPYLEVAEKIARKILPLETIIENLLLEKEVSALDHARKQMPDPWIVAKEFMNNAKHIKYDIEIIALAMSETREFILEHDLKSLDGKVQAIKRNVEAQISESPDPKTIRNWINSYGERVYLG